MQDGLSQQRSGKTGVNLDVKFEMSRQCATTRKNDNKTLLHKGPCNDSACGTQHEGVVSLVPACGGARVCHKGREDSTGSADRSIKSAELDKRCPLTMRHLVKRCINGCKSQKSQKCAEQTAERILALLANQIRRQSRAKVCERNGLKAFGNKASQNVSGAHRVAAPVPRTRQCRDGTPGPMNEKSTANSRQQSIPAAGRQKTIHTRSADEKRSEVTASNRAQCINSGVRLTTVDKIEEMASAVKPRCDGT